MSYSSTALHVTTSQGFHISDDIKAHLPPSQHQSVRKQDMVQI